MDIICSKGFFKNPNNQPLNKVFLELQNKTRTLQSNETLENLDKMLSQSSNQIKFKECYKTEVIKKPALDRFWIEEKIYEKFVSYLHLKEYNKEHFLQNRLFLIQLQFLVNCTYHQFWCYITYDANVTIMIKNFLRCSHPPHILNLDKKHSDLYNQIHSSISLIVQRLLDFNLSESEYMDEDVAHRILKDTELFNVENAFVICYLYNLTNSKLTQQIMDYCLTNNDDTFSNSINKFLYQISLELEDLINTMQFNPRILEDKIFFLFELASALHQFLSVCTPAIEIAFKLDLPLSITAVYQRIYTETRDLLEKEHEHTWIKNLASFEKWIAYGKYELVNVYNIFTSYCINSIVSLRDSRSDQECIVELYIRLISNALDNNLFMINYDKTFSVREQFQILVDCVADFDIQQTDYLLQSLDSIITEFSAVPEDVIQATFSTDTVTESNKATLEQCDEICKVLSQFLERYPNKKSAVLPKSVSIALEQYYDLTKQLGICDSDLNAQGFEKESSDQNVKAVLDVLPHLNKSFVLKCLETFNYNPNEVIAHVLSDDLPGDLSRFYNEPSTSNPSLREHTSKKQNNLNMKDVLDDSKEKLEIKQFVLKASYTLDLDDEYDDRAEIGKSLNHSDDESRILRHLGEVDEESDDSEPNSETEKDTRNKTRDFCMDPALLREQRAQKYQHAKQFRKNKNDDQKNEKSDQSGNKKMANKSTKPKHNRKGGAHWKMSKGMIPS